MAINGPRDAGALQHAQQTPATATAGRSPEGKAVREDTQAQQPRRSALASFRSSVSSAFKTMGDKIASGFRSLTSRSATQTTSTPNRSDAARADRKALSNAKQLVDFAALPGREKLAQLLAMPKDSFVRAQFTAYLRDPGMACTENFAYLSARAAPAQAGLSAHDNASSNLEMLKTTFLMADSPVEINFEGPLREKLCNAIDMLNGGLQASATTVDRGTFMVSNMITNDKTTNAFLKDTMGVGNSANQCIAAMQKPDPSSEDLKAILNTAEKFDGIVEKYIDPKGVAGVSISAELRAELLDAHRAFNETKGAPDPALVRKISDIIISKIPAELAAQVNQAIDNPGPSKDENIALLRAFVETGLAKLDTQATSLFAQNEGMNTGSRTFAKSEYVKPFQSMVDQAPELRAGNTFKYG